MGGGVGEGRRVKELVVRHRSHDCLHINTHTHTHTHSHMHMHTHTHTHIHTHTHTHTHTHMPPLLSRSMTKA